MTHDHDPDDMTHGELTRWAVVYCGLALGSFAAIMLLMERCQ